MKTKNIFKSLAFAMLLTTACNKNETTVKKGYELPVTINATRQGDDPATRATYNGSTRKLEFSTGDKLYVSGYNATVGDFAGILDWQSGGTFKGTILTENEYTGTVEDLFTSSPGVYACLLPAGYGTYGFISVVEKSGYDNMIMLDETKAFALTKATAIEQFSWESGEYDSSNGFELAPLYAILNFTITDLAASTEYAVVVSDGIYGRTGNVTTNGSGTATFAVGVWDDTESEDITLTVGGTPITLNLFGGTNTALAAGHVYNITRSQYTQTKSINDGNVNVTAGEHWLITGMSDSHKITIGDGATVTLSGVNINSNSYCIRCLGSATIILRDGTTNQLVSGTGLYPALWIGDNGTTLTIRGSTGALYVTSPSDCAGIGGGCGNIGDTCGNIVIEGGDIHATGGLDGGPGIGSSFNYDCGSITVSGGTVTATGRGNSMAFYGVGIGSGAGGTCGAITISGGTVTATGADDAAGIGSGKNGSCGAITISGGTVTATGKGYGVGIGSGKCGSCGAITITVGVTKVIASKKDYSAPHSIGPGLDGTCGTVTIGGIVYWDEKLAGMGDYEYKNGGYSYLTENTITYPAP